MYFAVPTLNCNVRFVVTNVLLLQIQGAVFGFPEEIAKKLFSKEIPAGNTISKISKVGGFLNVCQMSCYYCFHVKLLLKLANKLVQPLG